MTTQIDTINTILKEWGYDKVIPQKGNDDVDVNNEGNITYIGLSYNFKGTIPESFYTLTSLQRLSINCTSLKGEVSSKIQNFTELTFLDMSNNNTLTFNISYLKPLNKLTYIEVMNTICEGDISDLFNLTLLTYLSVGYKKNSNIKGDIKDVILLKNLNHLYLTLCNLTGNIPDISNLTKLYWVVLSNNNLNGSIPNISNLKNLSGLFLTNNNLSGSIPVSYTHLTLPTKA